MDTEQVSVIGKLSLCLILFLSVVVWLQMKRRKQMRIFEELGIPGPPPHFLFGNILELHKKGLLQCQDEWIKKYGKIVGYYHGLKPVLMIADHDLLKKVFVKDFHLFSQRPESVPLRVRSILDHIIPATQIMDSVLINLSGGKWKEVRSILSSAFSANKLKMMIPAVDKVTDVTLCILEKKSEREEIINMYEILQRLTLDIISAQAFAMDTDIQNKDSDPLLTSAKTILDVPYISKLMIFGKCFPELGILAMVINFIKMAYANHFSIPPLKITNVVGEEIKKRRDDPNARRPDLLQLLIDASAPDMGNNNSCLSGTSTNETDVSNNVLNGSTENSTNRVRRKLSDTEIKSNALLVFLAGYETTSSALAYAFYFLGKHPEYQEKILDDIVRHKGKGEELNYHTVSSFQEIERFLLETMRFYPPGLPFVTRVSEADVDYEDVRISKGIEITVPVNYMHNSAENWTQPEIFNPDRFLPENRSLNYATSYWAFGCGPRYCIGMRLVNITTKIVLVKILQKFVVHLADPQQVNVPSNIKFGTMGPTEVLVTLKPRFPVIKT